MKDLTAEEIYAESQKRSNSALWKRLKELQRLRATQKDSLRIAYIVGFRIQQRVVSHHFLARALRRVSPTPGIRG